MSIKKEEKKPTHVDDFIDYGTRFAEKETPQHEKYARWILNYFRGSAILKMDFHEFMKDHKLFCLYEGSTYRVTGASRLGDVWLTSNFEQETGYEKRVNVDDCSDWSKSA